MEPRLGVVDANRFDGLLHVIDWDPESSSSSPTVGFPCRLRRALPETGEGNSGSDRRCCSRPPARETVRAWTLS
jgi:hypothetical protein